MVVLTGTTWTMTGDAEANFIHIGPTFTTQFASDGNALNRRMGDYFFSGS